MPRHNFDLLMTGGFFGPTPYYYLEPLLHSTHITGAGATNWAGWNDPKTDQLLNQYASTSDTGYAGSGDPGSDEIMATKLPVIPVLDAVQFFEYSTEPTGLAGQRRRIHTPLAPPISSPLATTSR